MNTIVTNTQKMKYRFGFVTVSLFFIPLFLLIAYDVLKVPYMRRWQKNDNLKYVLLWNKFFDYPYFGFGKHDGQEIFINANCPVNRCYAVETADLIPVEEFDAVLFHTREFNDPSPFLFWKKAFVPSTRSPHQRYVFFLLESPINTLSDIKKWRHFFNWTMTYRLDSDIPMPYGRVLPINSSDSAPTLPLPTWLKPDYQTKNYNDIIQTKSHAVAWLVSHCVTQSSREEYVRLLAKYIGVDVFGDCSNKPWSRDDSRGFYSMMNKKYKFYLSFENSICKDYVTEKLFNIFNYNVVPIVYGEADYTLIAPPMSYINVYDYESPKDLADYLTFLDQNPEEYAKYFWWKKHYRAVTSHLHSLCQLCEMLHSDLPTKSYADIEQWWTGESVCREPHFSRA